MRVGTELAPSGGREAPSTRCPNRAGGPEFFSKARALARRVDVGPNTQKGCSFWEEWQQQQVLRDSGTTATIIRKIKTGRCPEELGRPGNSPVQGAASRVRAGMVLRRILTTASFQSPFSPRMATELLSEPSCKGRKCKEREPSP